MEQGYSGREWNKITLQDELTGHIHTEWAGQPVCVYETIDSTNVACAALAQEGAAHGTLVAANEQTAGRGRRGRSWESPGGNQLYFSLLLRPDLAPEKAPMLTLVMALAVAEAVRETTGLPAEIKWPNDLVVQGKKVCGILTEMRLDNTRKHGIDSVIVGVGVNVGARDFAAELADKATSLEQECGTAQDRGVLLGAILQAFERLYAAFVAAGDLSALQEQYNAYLVNLGRDVTVLDPQGTYNGIAEGITTTGELLVRLPDASTRTVFAGEVSVRGIYGYV